MLDGLSYDPVFRPALIGCLALVLAALAVAHARRVREIIGWRRAALTAALRLLSIAGLALVLMRPMALEPDPRPAAPPVFSVIVDRSASMCVKDAGEKSRADAVAQALKGNREILERGLGQNCVFKFYEFAEIPHATTFDQLLGGAEPSGEQTDIAAALTGAAEGENARHAGMLLISDGRVNHAAGTGGVIQAARYLRAHKVPVWTVAMGKEGSRAIDIEVHAKLSQNFLYVRQPGSLEVTVDQSGYQGWPAVVHLKREGVEVSAQRILLSEGTAQLGFPLTEAAPGLFQYTVEVEPLPGEADAANNRRAVFVRAIDRRTQVLLVEAEPYWDSKYMLRALSKDPGLEVTSFFQLNERKAVVIRQKPANPDRDPNPDPANPASVRIPRTRDEIFAYDVIVLGRGADRLYNAEELNLFKDYLTERGGNLIFARGRAYGDPSNPLAALEPVEWGNDKLADIRFALTEKGRDTFTFSKTDDPSLMIHELPSMLSVTRVEKEKSLAMVLARTETGKPGQELAVIAYQRYGKGKVMSLGSAGLWRWSLVPDEVERYQGTYEEFWSQLVRWLVAYSDFLPDQEITFEANRNAFQLGDPVRLAVRTRQVDPKAYHPTLDVNRIGGPATRLDVQADPDQPGVFTALFVPDREGEYQAVLHNNIGQPREDTLRFTVYQESRERRFVAADPSLMAQIARLTGGEPLALTDLKDLPERVRRFEQLTTERRRPIDAWDSPVFFYLLIGLVALEWLIRRLSGLV